MENIEKDYNSIILTVRRYIDEQDEDKIQQHLMHPIRYHIVHYSNNRMDPKNKQSIADIGLKLD